MASSPTGGLRLVVDALAARTGGGRRVAFELVRALASRPELDHVWLVIDADAVGKDLPAGNSRISVESVSLGTPLRVARRLRWEAQALPRLCRRTHADAAVVLAGMLPRALPCPIISMPANTLVFESGSVPNRLRRGAVLRTARRARKVLVASDYMAELVGPHLPVEVVPHGLDHDTFQPPERPGRELVYVADFYEHKRHRLVLDAWECLSPRPTLRLIGNPATDARLAAQIRTRGQRIDSARFALETLDQRGVAAAYSRARVALMASIRESFCLPMIEAAACGVPVVASDIPILHETGGPGATYVAGADPGVWATVIERLLTDDDGHARARAASLAHARGFSWDRKAGAVISAAMGGSERERG